MGETPISYESFAGSQGETWNEGGRGRKGPPPRVAALIEKKKWRNKAEQRAAERRSKELIKEDAIVREMTSGARTMEKLKDALNGKTGFEAKKDDFQTELTERVAGLQSASSFKQIRSGLEQEEAEREAAAKKRPRRGPVVKTSKLSFGTKGDDEAFSDDDLDA
mmetsp:Transcript_125652/g.268131  ORF Transcript_125652/g.268131 Transcript_125652/m.268131 type:complete len:164 (-) Transcript_125652:74-565(-)